MFQCRWLSRGVDLVVFTSHMKSTLQSRLASALTIDVSFQIIGKLLTKHLQDTWTCLLLLNPLFLSKQLLLLLYLKWWGQMSIQWKEWCYILFSRLLNGLCLRVVMSARYRFVVVSIFRFTPPPWDGMRCCRSDWFGLCLFCCYQPLWVVSQQSWFGLFFQFYSPSP